MKKKIIILICLLLISSLTTLYLFILANKTMHVHYGFTRILSSGSLNRIAALNLKYNSYYIAGVTPSHIYLGNVKNPLQLLIINSGLTETHEVNIKTEDVSLIKATHITIDSPNFYMTDFFTHTIFKGTVENFKARRYMYDSTVFAEAVPIGGNSFALRTRKRDVPEFVLAKETQYLPHIKYAPDLLEKQIDGLFCTDGMLHYSIDLNWLVYIYFYRNQFICMDTNLNLLYRGNTIDTVSYAQIKIAEVKSNHGKMQKTPPLLVNKKACVTGKWLFVNSGLMAKNDNEELFFNSATIDIYNLENGKYLTSFYLPNYEDHQTREFKVFKDRLIALSDGHLVIYQFDGTLF